MKILLIGVWTQWREAFKPLKPSTGEPREMNQSYEWGHDGYIDPMLTEHLDMQLVLVAINRIGVYGLENATYFRPYLADHFLQRVADEYPDDIAEVRSNFEIWLSANSPPTESDGTE